MILFATHFLSNLLSISVHGITSSEIEMILIKDLNLSITPAIATKFRQQVHQELIQISNKKGKI